MKHIIVGTEAWKYYPGPTPEFRCQLDRRAPTAVLEIRGKIQGIVPDVTKQFTLPENHFCIYKYPCHEVYFVQAGEDISNSCLLFVGHAGKRHERVCLQEEETTGLVIADYLISRNNINRFEIIVILKINQFVSFHTIGPCSNEVWRYQWNGIEVTRSVYANQSGVNTKRDLRN